MNNDGVSERGSDGEKPKKRVRPLSDKSRATLITTTVTVVGSVLVALFTTMGTIANSKSQLKETKEGIDTARTDISALQGQTKDQTEALLANTRKQLEANDRKLQEDQKQLEEMLKAARQFSETYATALPPAGTIAAFAGPVDNREKLEATGWLVCDGAEVSRTKYARLYGMIGNSWGHGNNADSFNLPDLRGVFLRGVNQGRTGPYADPDATTRPSGNAGGNVGNKVGSFQSDAFRSHTHTWNYGLQGDDSGSGHSFQEYTRTAGPNTDSIQSTGGSETRPMNAYVNYLIKF
jgi:microcystin-dependent protein